MPAPRTIISSSRTRNYLAGLVSGYTVTVVTAAVGLWLTPFILRFLDREEYAIFALAGTILMWLNLMDLGISPGLKVKAAQLTGRPDQEKLDRLTSTAFFTQMVVAGLMLAAGSGIVLVFPSFFHVRPDLQTQAMLVVALLVVRSAMDMGIKSFSGLLVAHQQIHVDNLIQLSLVLIRTILTVFLLLAGWQLLSLAVASVVAAGISALLVIWRCYHLLPGLNIRYRLASWDMLRSLGTLGVWFSLGSLAGIFIQSLDSIVAARLISLETVTTLTLTGGVYALSYPLLAQLTDTARPALGQLLGEGKSDKAFQAYRQLFAISTSGAVIVGLSLWAGNGFFVPWWVGPQNYGGIWLDLALAFNLIVHSWVLPNRATLAAALIVRPQTICRVIEGALNFILTIILGLKFGLLGIVIATGIAGLVTSCWYIPKVTAGLFSFPYFIFVKSDFLRIIIVGIILWPTSYLIREVIMFHGIIAAIFSSSCTFIIGFILTYLIAFDDSMRFIIRDKIALFIKFKLSFKKEL